MQREQLRESHPQRNQLKKKILLILKKSIIFLKGFDVKLPLRLNDIFIGRLESNTFQTAKHTEKHNQMKVWHVGGWWLLAGDEENVRN